MQLPWCMRDIILTFICTFSALWSGVKTSRFDWNQGKIRENLRKHGIGFETASLVFEDPWILSRKD